MVTAEKKFPRELKPEEIVPVTIKVLEEVIRIKDRELEAIKELARLEKDYNGNHYKIFRRSCLALGGNFFENMEKEDEVSPYRDLKFIRLDCLSFLKGY